MDLEISWVFSSVFIQFCVFWSRPEYYNDFYQSANYSFSATSACECLTIFYSRGRNNSVSIVLPCNLGFTALFCVIHWSAAFLITLLYMQCQFCQVHLKPTSYCISYCERNKDVTLGIRLRHTFWDKGAQKPVRQSKQRQKQTNVVVHSWFPGTLFILLITADSKIRSKKSFKFVIISLWSCDSLRSVSLLALRFLSKAPGSSSGTSSLIRFR